jgi:D-beta-D-heptose 7-phosphate kinase / D-beta-D-heptose 1-phosphate adenosyltransferase
VTAAKIVARPRLQQVLEGLRPEKRIVFTNGCFDILHVGHLRLLQSARRLGDLLVVGLNSDRSVQRLKGPRRPLVPALERAELLAGLECVDYVTVFDEDTPIESLLALRPHIHVKGGDYRPEALPEAEAARQVGAVIHIVPLVPGKSTTDLVERIVATGHNDASS